MPPGVDHVRFHPLGPEEKLAARHRLGLPTHGRLVVSVSRLVPRKGMDVLIEAVARLSAGRPDVTLAIGGAGRDRRRLEGVAGRSGAEVRFLGRVSDDDMPLLDGAADVWAMCCRDRWFGLEQEGFGIVFLEAAAAGVAQVAGRSGGADEAVVDGRTGLVVDAPGGPWRGRRPRSRDCWTTPGSASNWAPRPGGGPSTNSTTDDLARRLHAALVGAGG